MDPKSGPQVWTPGLDPRSGPQVWTPSLDPRSGPHVWTLSNDIHGGGLGLCGLELLSDFDTALIGLDRFRIGVRRLVCHQPDFRLADDDMGRVCRTYVTHATSLLEFPHFTGIPSGFLKRFG